MLSSLCLLIPLLGASGQDDRVVVEAVRSAYVSNREALGRFGSARFRFVDGPVDRPVSVKDTDLPLRPWTRQARGEGVYLFDGENRLFEHALPTQEYLRWRRKQGRGYFTYTASFRTLSDGTTILVDFPGVAPDGVTEIHTAKLEDAARYIGDYTHFPLSLGIPQPEPGPLDLGSVLGKTPSSDGEWRLESVENDVWQDKLLLKLTLTLLGHRLMYWIDLEKGAIPLRIRQVDPDGSLAVEMVHKDLRFVGNRGWLPFRMRRYIQAIGPDYRFTGGVHVWETELTEVDFDRPPPRSAFRMEFPRPAHLRHLRKHLLLEPRRVWDLDAISPAALARGQSYALSEPSVEPPIMPKARVEPPWWTWAFWACGGMLVLTGAWIGWRRLRHAA